jgi:hypothetical protein
MIPRAGYLIQPQQPKSAAHAAGIIDFHFDDDAFKTGDREEKKYGKAWARCTAYRMFCDDLPPGI